MLETVMSEVLVGGPRTSKMANVFELYECKMASVREYEAYGV